MKESDLYPIFEQHLVNTWSFKELQGSGQTFTNTYVYYAGLSINEFDVLGLYKHYKRNKYTITSIEVKLADFHTVFFQAYVRTTICDYCYMAFPLNWYFGSLLNELIKNYENIISTRLGLLVYDEERKTVWVVVPAKKSQRINNCEKNKRYRNRLINDLAGVKAGQTYTPSFIRRDELREVFSVATDEGRKVSIDDILAKMQMRKENEK